MSGKQKEAQARIKINKLLEESGWRFLDDASGPANIELEPGVVFGDLGDDFNNQPKGYIDFLLLDKDGRPLVVVEAKKESINPLSAKEQARNYARNCSARFIILSNGNIHYLWDTKSGNPEPISRFPTQESITQYEKFEPNAEELANAPLDENYVIESQMAGATKDPEFIDPATRNSFLRKNNLKQLRPYQVQAIKAIQESARSGSQRYLFEMATGTGKTLTSAAVIKLFLKTGNAKRVLFLVDRIELEDQANKAFKNYLKNDYTTVIYKERRDSWKSAEIVVSTIQSFLAGDKYRKDFSPTDFELVISDEAHRCIGGNSRAVFEYFVGYKLGLTATPKDYLRGVDGENPNTQREWERRMLLSTYETFGCTSGEPTFRYDLLKGVQDGFLINPTVVDARTEVTTKLLSEGGYATHVPTGADSSEEKTFNEKHYEKKFFNEETNIAMCKALLDNGFLDPVAKMQGAELFGKGIVFCVSQNHAAKITNILNRLAQQRWPGRYANSDFAMQITSQVTNAQQMTINFSNNNLGGKDSTLTGYETSKARICVTVGMMTTGYDCSDILNLALMRPVFSPADFVQIKGRGTRKHLFEWLNHVTDDTFAKQKERFKFFDYFATCEYFEKEFNYDEKIKLPQIKKVQTSSEGGINQTYEDESGRDIFDGIIDLKAADEVVSLTETHIGAEGMRIDREGFKRAVQEDICDNTILSTLWNNGDEQAAEEYTIKYVLNRPKHFLNLDGIRKAFNLDRRITVKEVLRFAFGQIDTFETKDELLEAEWLKFTEVNPVDQEHYQPVKSYFKAYAVDPEIRDIARTKEYARIYHCSSIDSSDFEKLNGYRAKVPEYINDYAYHLTNL